MCVYLCFSLSLATLVCVCFRSRCVFHPCLDTECMHFCGMHQQFTSYNVDLSASSWASTSTNSYPARLTDSSGGVRTHTFTHTLTNVHLLILSELPLSCMVGRDTYTHSTFTIHQKDTHSGAFKAAGHTAWHSSSK